MKKSLFIFLISLISNAQTTEKITIAEFSIKDAMYNNAVFLKQITGNKITKVMYFSFQNSKYSEITDIGTIAIYDRKTLELFAEKLEEYTNLPLGKELTFTCNAFKISRLRSSENIFLDDSDGKYFVIPNIGDLQGAIDLSNFLIDNFDFFPKPIKKPIKKPIRK